MSDLLSMIEEMSEAEQAIAVRVLDAVSRPLNVREIEVLLRNKGVPRSRAVITAAAVKNLSIIAVAGPDL